MEETISYDVIVIGAGAAGMMAAGTAARNGKSVLLLEKMEKSGRKVRITGMGRCNITNTRPEEEFMAHVRSGAEFFATAFAEFNNLATIKFFDRMGCKTVTERGDRVFPKSGKAWDVATALLDYCVNNGVKIEYNMPVSEIVAVAGHIYAVKYRTKRGYERKIEAPHVIVTTGGLSYEATGSSGDGLAFAADTGHDIVPVRPSLTPLKTNHPQLKRFDSLWLKNTNVKLVVDGEFVREEFGEITFSSNRGVEGAVALRLSRDAVDALIDGKSVSLVMDLKGALTEEVLIDRIKRDIAEMEEEETFADLLRGLVPRPLVIPLCDMVDVFSKSYIRKITDEDIVRLARQLKNIEVPITDYAPFEFAVVTAGGVSLDDVNPYTMESRKVKGLYFAGEVLDLDADTGGYNLQIAFSTGRLAGMLKK